jgi:hypothetical protein
MNEKISRYPLQWPAGWKRLQAYQRKSANFSKHGKRLSVFDGIGRVLSELKLLGVSDDDVVISTNVETRLDGLPRSDRAAPQDVGVAVYWVTKAGTPAKCMAVDRYDKVADNLAAVAATLEAFRAVERHGGAAILDRAFVGFAALPAPALGQRDWWTVLDLTPNATEDQVRSAHRRLTAVHHPDRGGSEERMAELNLARDIRLKELGL